MIPPCSEFWLSILILKVQRTCRSLKSLFRALEDAGGSRQRFGILILTFIGSLIHPYSELGLYFEGAKNIPCSLRPYLGLWQGLEVPDLGFASSLLHLHYNFWLSIFIFKVQRTFISFNSWFWALEDTGGFWLMLRILMWICSMVFDTPKIQTLALYLDFEGAENI